MFGTTATGGSFFGSSPNKGSFRGTKNPNGVTNPKLNFVNQNPGIPGEYDLAVNQGATYVGVPWYHFRSDWDEGGGTYNFINQAGNNAQDQHLVVKWTNANFPGDTFPNHHLVADKNHPANQWLYSGELSFTSDYLPRCKEKMINGVLHKGLRFAKGTWPVGMTGNNYRSYMKTEGFDEMLNFWGASLDDWHFNTGGGSSQSDEYKNTGATFVFVLEPDENTNYFNAGTSPESTTSSDDRPHAYRQLLLYNRVPGTTAEQMPTTTGTQPWYTNLDNWPTMDDYGVQWWWQGNMWKMNVDPLSNASYIVGCPQFEAGPSVNYVEDPINDGYSVPVNQKGKAGFMSEADSDGHGGSESRTFDDGAYLTKGLQIVMLEYDNRELFNVERPDPGSPEEDDLPTPAIRSGPRMRIYSMGGSPVLTNPTGNNGFTPCYNPWEKTTGENGNTIPAYVLEPRAESVIPAMPDHPLLKDGTMFVGGAPPQHATETWWGVHDQTGLGCEESTSPFGPSYGYCPDTSHTFMGTIYEFIAYNAVLTDADRRDLFAILSQKFGI